MNSSFEEFLSAIENTGAEEYKGKHGEAVVQEDYLGVAHKSDWEYSSDSLSPDEILEQINAEVEDTPFEDTLEDTEEDADGSEEESDEEAVYDIEDWNSVFTLPDGTEVNGQMLYEFKNFNEQKEAFQQETATYRAREEEVVRNANIGYDALTSMEAELRSKPLDQATMAQLAVINSVKHRFEQFSTNLQSSYSNHINEQARIAQETMANNVDACFDKFPQFDQEVINIKGYLADKGFSEAETEQLFRDTQFNPRTISMLIDAATVHKANKSVYKEAPRPKHGKLIATYSKEPQVEHFEVPHGISSYDRDSYKAFSALGI